LLQVGAILFGAAFCVASAWSLGRFLLRGVACARTVQFAIGAAALSYIVYACLLAGVANRALFAGLGICALATLWVGNRSAPETAMRPGENRRHSLLRCGMLEPPAEPMGRYATVLLGAIFAAYGLLYFFHALAPEIQPDAYTYHLGLVREYDRLGRFPHRIGFYEMLPQGLEMLFLFAFAFGRHSAAKLVHLAFLAATVPAILQLGRRLGVSDTLSLSAAALYLCAPVVGASGTAAYNDAALAFFVVVTAYLLAVWRDVRDWRCLTLAGVSAGFCYAVKLTGLVVLPAVLVFAAAHTRRIRQALPAAMGFLAIAPWMARDVLLTGNPLAPLCNNLFPNAWFHAFLDRVLGAEMRSYGGAFSVVTAPWQLTISGNLEGILGPVFLLAPLGLLSLRYPAGRLCWAAASIAALPSLWNAGTRFLMPALPFLALALGIAVSRRISRTRPGPEETAVRDAHTRTNEVAAIYTGAGPVCLALAAAQALLCWPAVISSYASSSTWHLHGVPWRAALRLETERAYLERAATAETRIAELLESKTRPEEKVFALMAAPKAYVDRQVLEFWHSAVADNLTESLKLASTESRAAFDINSSFPARPIMGVRVRTRQSQAEQLCLYDIRLLAGSDVVHPSPHWTLRARPYPQDAPLALDGNLATRWCTWGPVRPGNYIAADLDRAQLLTGIRIVMNAPLDGIPLEVFVLPAGGRWERASLDPVSRARPPEDLRYAATRAVRAAGFRYILAPTGREGLAPVGRSMVGHEHEWGLELAGQVWDVCLFRII
jgi:4-amino-4-deoxy-L-arabinose transferase-like glycosyltransferase